MPPGPPSVSARMKFRVSDILRTDVTMSWQCLRESHTQAKQSQARPTTVPKRELAHGDQLHHRSLFGDALVVRRLFTKHLQSATKENTGLCIWHLTIDIRTLALHPQVQPFVRCCTMVRHAFVNFHTVNSTPAHQPQSPTTCVCVCVCVCVCACEDEEFMPARGSSHGDKGTATPTAITHVRTQHCDSHSPTASCTRRGCSPLASGRQRTPRRHHDPTEPSAARPPPHPSAETE